MLELVANGVILDISNVSFNLTLRSPIVGGTAGSYVYAFSIPNTPTNAAAFGFPFRINRLDISYSEKPGLIKFNGNKVKEGNWIAKKSKATTIQIEMIVGAGLFSDKINDIQLPEILDKETFIATNIIAHANEQIHKSYPEINHQFPSISNPNFYGEKNEQFGGIINNFEDVFLVTTENNNCLVPQLYLLYIISKIYEYAGYTVKGDPFEDEMFKKALVYNNFALDNLKSTFFYGKVLDELIDLNTNREIRWDTDIQDPGNHYTVATGKYRVTFQGRYNFQYYLQHRVDHFNLTPDFEYYYVEIIYNGVVLHTFEHPCHPDATTVYVSNLNYQHLIEQINVNHDLQTRIYYKDVGGKIYDAKIIEGWTQITNLDAPEINEYENNIYYRNHVKNMDTKEFLNNFFALAEMLPFINEKSKTVEFKYLQNLLKDNTTADLSKGLIKETLKVDTNSYRGTTFKFEFEGPDDLLNDNFRDIQTDGAVFLYSNLPNPSPVGSIYLVTSLKCYYKRIFDEENLKYDWQAIGDDRENYVDGEGKDPVSSKFAPILMRNIPLRYQNRHMPAIHAPGTSNAFGIKNDFPLRIMFYVGIETPAGDNNNYPFASTVKYNTTGGACLPISWDWEEIKNRYWEEIISWYKRRLPLEFQNEVSPAFISNLNFENKFEFQKSLIILEEVYTKILNKSFGGGKFKGWTK
jgi:hypothetical protein